MPAWIIRLRRFFTSFVAGTLLAANCAAAFDYNYEAAEPRFENVALEAGVEHVYGGSWEHYTGGGVAAFDCDRDGDADLFFAGGANPGQLFRNDSTKDGGLRFSALGDAAPHDRGATGAYPLDVDGDGNMDLVVLRIGANRFYRGLGACRFEASENRFNFDGGAEWTTAFSATWENDNRFPTLAFGN